MNSTLLIERVSRRFFCPDSIVSSVEESMARPPVTNQGTAGGSDLEEKCHAKGAKTQGREKRIRIGLI
jgi:hypothetical protein